MSSLKVGFGMAGKGNMIHFRLKLLTFDRRPIRERFGQLDEPLAINLIRQQSLIDQPPHHNRRPRESPVSLLGGVEPGEDLLQ